MDRSELEDIAKRQEERVRVEAVIKRANEFAKVFKALKKSIDYASREWLFSATESYIEFAVPCDLLIDVVWLREFNFKRDDENVFHSRVNFSIRGQRAMAHIGYAMLRIGR
ncbi:hypothetical protein HGT70_04650 [Rosenbergiella collisarenosi]|uniref:hypothetical protein n=1 Tax=Rosenbergiella collisarenosi TaxID=1544695 RepID=UPI001BDB0BD4|nr:hypothetical protein [Rosenbergiella collisarenosi]MBT0720573.1 hypothetical protein [Rosenbergiella collisarenosi]